MCNILWLQIASIQGNDVGVTFVIQFITSITKYNRVMSNSVSEILVKKTKKNKSNDI